MNNNKLKTPEEIRAKTKKNQIHFAEENLRISYRTYQYRLQGKQDWRLSDLAILCEINGGSVVIPKSKNCNNALKISIVEI